MCRSEGTEQGGGHYRRSSGHGPAGWAADNVALVVAHPDDEVVGAGGLLGGLTRPTLVHITDGAPRNMLDAFREGFSDPREYASARRRELLAALEVAGIDAGRRGLDVADQEASYELVALARALAEILAEADYGAVLTHAYEGGHPDHDATAFAAHAACALLRRSGRQAPELREFASYHAGQGGIEVYEFLDPSRTPVETLYLCSEARKRKQQMVDCFRTQRAVLSSFPVELERFRLSPGYDFTKAPHDGRLFYEQFDWGITGTEWRDRARAAIAELDLEEMLWV